MGNSSALSLHALLLPTYTYIAQHYRLPDLYTVMGGPILMRVDNSVYPIYANMITGYLIDCMYYVLITYMQVYAKEQTTSRLQPAVSRRGGALLSQALNGAWSHRLCLGSRFRSSREKQSGRILAISTSTGRPRGALAAAAR